MLFRIESLFSDMGWDCLFNEDDKSQ